MSPDPTTLESRLRDLRTPAPAALEEQVLTATGHLEGWTTIEAPVGTLFLAFSPHGIGAVAPAADADEFREVHAARTGRRLGAEQPLPPRLRTTLLRTLESGRLGTLPVDLRGLTDFQQAVLRKTAEIPPGELRPYGWVAREISHPRAARAVGSALRKNPVPVVIPCHRVGRSDGTVGNYAFGPEMKRSLLRLEGADPDAIDALAARGVRLTGSDTTGIFCLPTCRHARRIGDRHRVAFGSAGAAVDAGYRPCKVCRPAAA
jgi:O-6-methylguanine DNA methyltransferase